MKSIVILDFGSIFTESIKHLYDKWFIPVYVLPYNAPLTDIMDIRPHGIVLSGSPDMLSENVRYSRENKEDLKAFPMEGEHARRPHPGVWNLSIPILGICYGHQLIAEHFGVPIVKSHHPEYSHQEGLYAFYVEREDPLFKDMPRQFDVYMAHSDIVPRLPEEFELLGRTDATDIAAFRKGDIFGVQFHPEADPNGISKLVLKNFADYAFWVKRYDK